MVGAIHSIYDAMQYLHISETLFFLLLLFINMGTPADLKSTRWQ